MVKSKFAILTHILTLLAHFNDEWLSSSFIAASISTNPALIRKELQILKEHDLIQSREGKSGGVMLSKDASKIFMSDILRIAKGEHHIFGYSKNEPLKDCPVGSKITPGLNSLYSDVDNLVLEHLSEITLEDFQKGL